MQKWYAQNGDQQDVIVSTRVRLARNLQGLPFPARMSRVQREDLQRQVMAALEGVPFFPSEEGGNEGALQFLDMLQLSKETALSYVQKHLISPEFAGMEQPRMLALSENESISVMVGEEDDIRIQVLGAGLCLEQAYMLAGRVDDALDQKLAYAFDERLGYLTQCPTNLGTGLRASVMLHLPALEQAGMVARLMTNVSKLGLTIRGTYGEGSRVSGSCYQLSNQVTLGVSEQEVLANLTSVGGQIVSQERLMRKRLFSDQDAMEDSIFRALGVLKHARILSSDEFSQLISLVRMGVSGDVIKGITPASIDALVADAGSGSIMAREKRDMTARERDKARAALVRARLSHSCQGE